MKNKIDQYTDTDDDKLFALIEQGDEERLVAETLKVNPILFEANSMKSLLMVF